MVEPRSSSGGGSIGLGGVKGTAIGQYIGGNG